MNWELFGDYCRLRDTYAGNIDQTQDKSRRWKMEESLIETYLRTHLHTEKTLHPRRTLDQFYYPSLANTKCRDADQTISKWTGKPLPENGRSHAVDDSMLIMVDQLWCWVLDDGKSLPRDRTSSWH
jgi:hypothetical protein